MLVLDENEELSSDIWRFEYDGRLNFLSELPARLRQYIGSAASALDVDICRDFKEIQVFQHKLDKSESLLAHMPQLNDFIDLDDKRNGNPEYVCTSSNKIRFWLRHPKYPTLKWSLTAHNLFHKQNPYTQWIKMSCKLIDKYPELENQVLLIGNEIREGSVFQLKCACGNTFKKSYAALMGKTRVCMCSECLKAYRLKNLGIVADE